jgi:hypothetical protein
MSETKYQVGDLFPIQYVWKLPDGDFLRAVFEAEVLHLDDFTDKYVLRLRRLLAGRQEQADGAVKPVEALSREYWELVGRIPGKKVSVAFEVDDGRPLWLRLTTLTGEHKYFDRLAVVPDPPNRSRQPRPEE